MSDWTDLENDTLVAGFFAMLDDHRHGRPFVKAERHKALAELLQRRTVKSIECKLQNVSEALQAFGYPWLKGFVPETAFQMSLADEEMHWIDAQGDWTGQGPSTQRATPRDPSELFVRQLWTLANRLGCRLTEGFIGLLRSSTEQSPCRKFLRDLVRHLSRPWRSAHASSPLLPLSSLCAFQT